VAACDRKGRGQRLWNLGLRWHTQNNDVTDKKSLGTRSKSWYCIRSCMEYVLMVRLLYLIFPTQNAEHPHLVGDRIEWSIKAAYTQ